MDITEMIRYYICQQLLFWSPGGYIVNRIQKPIELLKNKEDRISVDLWVSTMTFTAE